MNTQDNKAIFPTVEESTLGVIAKPIWGLINLLGFIADNFFTIIITGVVLTVITVIVTLAILSCS